MRVHLLAAPDTTCCDHIMVDFSLFFWTSPDYSVKIKKEIAGERKYAVCVEVASLLEAKSKLTFIYKNHHNFNLVLYNHRRNFASFAYYEKCVFFFTA